MMMMMFYHEMLRTTFGKFVSVSPSVDRNIAFYCAVKAMKDTLGSKRLVPAALAFREFSELRTPSEAYQRGTSLI